ncbi:MAG: YcaQ family DNA glycosylase, partial [Caulobacteraceae bacterium]|nr:YcaQ family DNA glycosylase [Caulobacter sp.]
MSAPERLSAAAARRIALAAQGFAEPRPPAGAALDWGRIGRAVRRLGLLQIDSVNVLARAHYLPLFSRLGPYSRARLEAAAWGARPRRLFEYWAHEASLIPVEHEPLFRWRMARATRGEGTYGRLAPFAGERRAEAEAVLARIAAEGALPASAFGGRGEGGWWGWSDAKSALEWLFWAGRLTTRTRTRSFERVYDLPERVLPAAVLAQPTPAEAEAHRALLLQAGAALGVGTAG